MRQDEAAAQEFNSHNQKQVKTSDIKGRNNNRQIDVQPQ